MTSEEEFEKIKKMSVAEIIFNPLARDNMEYEYITPSVIKFIIKKEKI